MSERFENQQGFYFARGLSPFSGAPHTCARVEAAAAMTTITGHVNPQITKPCSAACSSAPPFHPVASTLVRPRALGLAMAAAAAPVGEHARRRCRYGFRIHLRHASDQNFLRHFHELHPPLFGSIPHPEFIPMRPAPEHGAQRRPLLRWFRGQCVSPILFRYLRQPERPRPLPCVLPNFHLYCIVLFQRFFIDR